MMNWGYKILFVYVLFILGILLMVFKSSTQKTDLVTTDYYAKELKYQEKIDEMNRVVALSAPVEFIIKDNLLIIHFPTDFAGKKLTGEAILYCPSDENKDVKQSFSVQDAPAEIPVSSARSGMYELHLSWQAGGVNYYFEKKIFM